MTKARSWFLASTAFAAATDFTVARKLSFFNRIVSMDVTEMRKMFYKISWSNGIAPKALKHVLGLATV